MVDKSSLQRKGIGCLANAGGLGGTGKSRRDRGEAAQKGKEGDRTRGRSVGREGSRNESCERRLGRERGGVLIDDVEKQRLNEARAPCPNRRRQVTPTLNGPTLYHTRPR
jgi:hypothetical protein